MELNQNVGFELSTLAAARNEVSGGTQRQVP